MLVLVQSDQIKEADVLSELNQSVSFATAVSNYEQAIVIDLAMLFNQDKTGIMLSNKHYRSLVHSMMGQLTQKFEWVCRDNGVKYDEAWMIDWYGNEIPPDLVEEIPLTSTGEGGYTRKTWLSPEQFICCACYTDFDGTVKLIYQCLRYEAQGNFEPDQYNVLMRRRLWTIGYQVKRKLTENYLRYSDNLDGFVAPRWDTCSYYKGVKMQL